MELLLVTRQINEFLGSSYKVEEIAEWDDVSRRFVLATQGEWNAWLKWKAERAKR